MKRKRAIDLIQFIGHRRICTPVRFAVILREYWPFHQHVIVCEWWENRHGVRWQRQAAGEKFTVQLILHAHAMGVRTL
jgi:hypothetical protein